MALHLYRCLLLTLIRAFHYSYCGKFGEKGSAKKADIGDIARVVIANKPFGFESCHPVVSV